MNNSRYYRSLILCTVKPVLSGHSKTDKTNLMTNGSLIIKFKSIAECPWSINILQYFWPALSNNGRHLSVCSYGHSKSSIIRFPSNFIYAYIAFDQFKYGFCTMNAARCPPKWLTPFHCRAIYGALCQSLTVLVSFKILSYLARLNLAQVIS